MTCNINIPFYSDKNIVTKSYVDFIVSNVSNKETISQKRIKKYKQLFKKDLIELNSNNEGIVYIPYIFSQNVQVISSSHFGSSKFLKFYKRKQRIKKLKNILYVE